MQEPHSAKGTLQGLGFAESMVNTVEQSAKFYWRMWGPLGQPMVCTVDAWAGVQRSYLQWLREASAAGGRGMAQRGAKEAERSLVETVREAESSGKESAREAEQDVAGEAERSPSEGLRSIIRESVRRSAGEA